MSSPQRRPATQKSHPGREELPFSQENQRNPFYESAYNVLKRTLAIIKLLISKFCHLVSSFVCSSKSKDDDNYYYDTSGEGYSWSCRMGTKESDGIWINLGDKTGLMMSLLVWMIILYSAICITFIAKTKGISPIYCYIYDTLTFMSLSSHLKCSLTEPGVIPKAATHSGGSRRVNCSRCATIKPPLSHHCRICNRCVARMDHHCPWMNNCIGAGNLKHFILFLVYTFLLSFFALILLGFNYFFCSDIDCEFTSPLLQVCRVLTLLSVLFFLFLSSMLMNVTYGIISGIGTIDRMKKKANNSINSSNEEGIEFVDIFGIGPALYWFLPTDPVFQDYEKVFGWRLPIDVEVEVGRD